jgi:hypothetical protein
MIQEHIPYISQDSAWQQIKCYVLSLNAAIGVLKKTTQKVQATTNGRTNIKVAQQYRWHPAVDEVYEYLRRKNTRQCQLTSKMFGEVMPHFLIGLDKMCLMSEAHGNLRVFASADKKTGEVATRLTLLHRICAHRNNVGHNWVNIFPDERMTCRKHFTIDYLMKYGMKPGSTIIMSENVYIMDDAWLKVSKLLSKAVVSCRS